MAAGESLQGEGVLGCYEQELDSPAGHTAIYWRGGRSPMLWMDWQHTQETSRWQTCAETLPSPQEQPLDQTEHGQMHESRRPWSHDSGRKACIWECLRMGLPGFSPYSRAEKADDWGSKSEKTWIMGKIFPGPIKLNFRGQTGDKNEMQILTNHYITIS